MTTRQAEVAAETQETAEAESTPVEQEETATEAI